MLREKRGFTFAGFPSGRLFFSGRKATLFIIPQNQFTLPDEGFATLVIQSLILVFVMKVN